MSRDKSFPLWVVPVLLLSLSQVPTSAVAAAVGVCPSDAGSCTSCPTTSSLASVKAGTFPGGSLGQFVNHFSYSLNSANTLIKSFTGTTVDLCCGYCTSEADCYYFSWQQITGSCLLYNVDECSFSDAAGTQHVNYVAGGLGTDWYSFPACRSVVPNSGKVAEGLCPTAGCNSCPTAAQWTSVSNYQYPGITYGSYENHQSASGESKTQLEGGLGLLAIETCCQACASNSNCLYFSWKWGGNSNSGSCTLFSSQQCAISGQGGKTNQFFKYEDDKSYSMQICGHGTPPNRTPPPPPPPTPTPTPVSVTSPPSPPPGVKGDPHFAGWDGVHFDFTGRPGKSYCLLSDDRVHINMFLQGYVDKVNGSDETHTWIKGMGILSKGHKLGLHARESGDPSRGNGYMKKMVADGKEITLAEGENFETTDGALRIQYQGHRMDGDDDIDVYEVTVQGAIKFLLKMRPEIPSLRIAEDAWIHFSMEVLEEELTAEPHGILGQTLFNLNNPDSAPTGYTMQYSGVLWAWQVAGADGTDYIQGKPRDYMTSGVLSPDCRFTRLEGVPEGKLGVFPMGCSRKSLVC